ncbi:hypothetical protein HPB48_001364 [Haemaphysalis longicornis]|uniref:Disease resistance R13L4/SHOC-2-like LRR domain-containing protein n=1 Tax=Haemaphysalis longicornis TaxID=44386 RepID=A0A9J6F799_HAELO|nr:hypothetical protein HPB48_001364 [Haemaphysalis longicornis]
MSEKDLKDIDCDKYKVYPGRRFHTFMSPEDVAAGKKSHWPELEITGVIRNLSPALWTLSHLRGLYLNDNCLERLPPGIRQLECLTILDLSSNKLCSLPAEVGELVLLRELYLNFNLLKRLPYELGKLFRLTELGEETVVDVLRGGAPRRGRARPFWAMRAPTQLGRRARSRGPERPPRAFIFGFGPDDVRRLPSCRPPPLVAADVTACIGMSAHSHRCSAQY